jgi:hypothetical protein
LITSKNDVAATEKQSGCPSKLVLMMLQIGYDGLGALGAQ